MESANYAVRTRQNVKDSDGTLILFEDTMSRGTELTAKCASQLKRPLISIDVIDLLDWDDDHFAAEIKKVISWLEIENVNVLNVAGPRESSSPGIGGIARMFLVKLFESQVPAQRT